MSDHKQNLPEGWRWVRLSEVCNLVNGDAYRDSDWSSNGYKIVRIQNLNDPSKPFNHWAGTLKGRVCLKTGDVLLAWSGTPGTSFGAHLWMRGDAVLNQHIFRVDLDSVNLAPEWAVFAINQQLEAMIGKAHGGVGLRHVTKGQVESLQLLLPSLPEQKRITVILNKQLAAVERTLHAAEERLAAIRSLPAACLRQVFPQPDQELPEGWNKAKLEDVSHLIQYGFTASADFSTQFPKFLRITDIQDGKVDWSSVPGCNTLEILDDYYLENGDIVFARTGATTGKSYLIENPPTSVFASYLIRIRPTKQVNPNYLYQFFQSDIYWRQIREGVRGGAQGGFNATMLSNLNIILPSFSEQQRIVSILEDQMIVIEHARTAAEAELAAINALPAALLRRAFAGEL